MSFRIQGKHFFLTYPHCALSKEELLTQLQNDNANHEFSYVIASELHADGTPHLHALLSFRVTRNLRNQRHFDVCGHHPNIQNARDIKATTEYIKKGGDFISNYSESQHLSWGEIITTATDEISFLELIKNHHPREYCGNLERYEYSARKLFKPVPQVQQLRRLSEFKSEEHLENWLGSSFRSPRMERPLSLLLLSPSRFGKTEWARSLGPHTYWNGMVNIDDYNEDGTYVIFDDFEWDFMPNKKQWFGAQKTFAITDKYRKKKTITHGNPIIYLCNEMPNMTPTFRQWFDQNCVIVHLMGKLY